jgi:hypothetical protein
MHVRIFSTTAKQNHGSEHEEKCNQRSTMGENPPKSTRKYFFFFSKGKKYFLFPQVTSTHQHIKLINSSTHQHINTVISTSKQPSTHQHTNTSTHQHININTVIINTFTYTSMQ